MFASLRKPSRPLLISAALLPALSGWSMYFGVEVLGLQVIWLTGLLFLSNKQCFRPQGGYDRLAIKKTLGALLCSILFLSPLLFRLIWMQHRKQKPFAGFPNLTMELPLRVARWLAFMQPTWLTLAILLFALFGAIYGIRKFRPGTVFFLLWLFPLQAAQVVAYRLADHAILARYHILYIPPLLIVAAIGFLYCLNQMKPSNQTRILVLLTVCISLAYCAHKPVKQWRRVYKPDIRKVLNFLAENASPDDVVVGSGLKTVLPYTYYQERLYPTTPPVCDFRNLPQAISLLQNARKMWIIYHRVRVEENLEFLRHLDPSLPLSAPLDPIVRVVERPDSWYEALMKMPQLREDLARMELQAPILLKMEDERTVRLLDRTWSTPEAWGKEFVRRMQSNTGDMVFRLTGDLPKSITVRLVSFLQNGTAVSEFAMWWNDILLLKTTSLDHQKICTLSASVPSDASSREFQVLRFICRSNDRKGEMRFHEGEPVPSLALASIEMR
jgi:hypothetical protein